MADRAQDAAPLAAKIAAAQVVADPDPRYLRIMSIRRQLAEITAESSDEEIEYDEKTGSGLLAALRLADSFLKDACTALHPEGVPSVWEAERV
jgi:hypothetical protein